MEYIDVLDEEGNKTGKTASHQEVHEKGLWHRTVHVWFMNLENEILLQLRGKSKSVYPNMWDISAAGHISAGEDPSTAGLRETKEEIGFDIPIDELKKIGEIKVEKVHRGGTFLDKEFMNIYLVKSNFDINDFRIDKDEVEDLQFIPFGEFKKGIEEKRSDFVPNPQECKLLEKALQNIA